MRLTHGSLFSGIGGFDLAALWAGIPTLWQVEKDEFCRKVLAKNFPDAKRFEDVTKTEEYNLEKVSIISGGFPCQPFSVAGNRKGKNDERYLWEPMRDTISRIKPDWVIAENVPGIVTMGVFETVCSDLEGQGYEVQSFAIPASAVKAPHTRERVWIVANAGRLERSSGGHEAGEFEAADKQRTAARSQQTNAGIPAGFTSIPREPERADGPKWRGAHFPRADRMDYGLSKGLDRGNRLKALGNAIVPQVAKIIFDTIVQIERE